jgi:hypothetical protein
LLDTHGMTSPGGEMPEPTHEIDMDELEEGEEVAARKPVTQPKKPEKSRGRTFALVGVCVLLLVAVGGWVLFSKRDQIFPNSGADLAAGTDLSLDHIELAKKLHEEGRVSFAIAQLRRLPPSDPQYAEAQALIAQWESGDTEQASTGPDEEQLARRELIMDQARRSVDVGDNLLAWELLERANEIVPLNPEELALQTTVRANLEASEPRGSPGRMGSVPTGRLGIRHPQSLAYLRAAPRQPRRAPIDRRLLLQSGRAGPAAVRSGAGNREVQRSSEAPTRRHRATAADGLCRDLQAAAHRSSLSHLCQVPPVSVT